MSLEFIVIVSFRWLAGGLGHAIVIIEKNKKGTTPVAWPRAIVLYFSLILVHFPFSSSVRAVILDVVEEGEVRWWCRCSGWA